MSYVGEAAGLIGDGAHDVQLAQPGTIVTTTGAPSGNEVRRVVLTAARRAGVGHIGSALSVAELVAAIYAVRRPLPFDDPDRDRIVLSKGHAALALYALLHLHGVLDEREIESYCQDGGSLGVHPERHTAGIDFATGSLGQGICMAVGAAMAARLQDSPRKVYALISDAECNEGSVWEAAMFAGHHRLNGLTVLVDSNQQQAFGYVKDVSSVVDMAQRWRAFGWDAVEADGHDEEELVRAMSLATDRPKAIIAHTTFGRGVDFMQSKIEWHYLPMTDEQYTDAMRQVATS